VASEEDPVRVKNSCVKREKDSNLVAKLQVVGLNIHNNLLST